MRRVGVDTGGTFTDGVLWDDETGELRVAKVSSDKADPSRAVVACVAKLTRGEPASVAYLTHGTTVATNASLEMNGPRIGLICTAGFRDVLEIARLSRDPDQLYDLHAQQAPAVVRRRDRLEVTERIDARGEIVTPLDEQSVIEAATVLKRRSIGSIGVCLLHSYANPAHEQRVKEILAREMPEAVISISCEVLPEFREYERTTTTALNAYLAPIVGEYLRRLQAAVEAWSSQTHLWVMQSSGGVASVARTAELPVSLLLSGPSGGVVAGYHIMQQLGLDRSITMDMGGTSYDVCLVPDTGIPMAQERRVMGVPVKMPSVDILTIGAGGGSIGWIDAAGQFCVGPRSAGATPGPACYGRGGEEPTVTDANLVLGILGGGQSLGGEVELRFDLATAACETLGRKLGLSGQATAWGIRRIVNAAMAGATRAISVGRGYDPRDFPLIAFGGAGPVHAVDIARELEIPEVIVPQAAGCLSAFGLVVSDVSRDYLKTVISRLRPELEDELDAELATLATTAHVDLAEERIPADRRDLITAADVRYVGEQSYVTVPVGNTAPGWLDATVAAFHQLHERIYGFSAENDPVEIVNVRLKAVGRLHADRIERVADVAETREPPPPIAHRDVAFGPEPSDILHVPVYSRTDFLPGTVFKGPAIIEETDTTLVIGPSDVTRIDAALNIRIEVH